MNFSELTIADLSTLEKAKQLGYTDEWNKEMIISSINGNNFFGEKILEENNVLGYVHYSVAVDTADINSVFVFSEYRKKGIGYMLLQKILEGLKTKGVKKVFLEVRENNFSAIKLYEKLGFNKISTRKKYYSNGENANVMLREI